MSEDLTMQYPPCPSCGKRSLAAITEHICDICKEVYRLCPWCDNPEENIEERELNEL